MENQNKILITGGAGFMGSHLADHLIKKNYRVVVVDNLSTGKRENINLKAKFYKANICNFQIIKKIFEDEKPNFVFHFATQTNIQKSIENPLHDAKIDILGSLNILENCKKFKIRKIIFASTGAVYGNAKIIPTSEDCPVLPLSPYGVAKLTIENYLDYYWKIFCLPYISFRYSNVYGPRQDFRKKTGVIAIFFNKILRGERVIINGDGKQTRDFLYVKDAVEATVLALKKNVVGIFNIGTMRETSINVIFRKIREIIGSSVNKVHGSPIEFGEQRKSCLNIKKARKELFWQPKYKLEKGLKEMRDIISSKTTN